MKILNEVAICMLVAEIFIEEFNNELTVSVSSSLL